MKELYFVGMAFPKPKQTEAPTYPSGSLTDLVALDPRHGVFPNLVMAPLMAALYYLNQKPGGTQALMGQLGEILEDDSVRRFNVLYQPQGDTFRMHETAVKRLEQLNDNQLWLVFGIWSISALLKHLLHGDVEFSERELLTFTRNFVRRALRQAPGTVDLPKVIPTCKAPLPGIFFKLCSDPTDEAQHLLSNTLLGEGVDPARVPAIRAKLRSMIPLPHNEAYDQYPFGRGQNCFMTCRDPRHHREMPPPPEVFWRYMGRRIAERLTA